MENHKPDLYDLGLAADLAMLKRSPIDRRRILKLGVAGIGLLLSSSGLIEQKGGRALIAGAHDNVAHTFEIVHLERIVSFHPDVESAVLNLGLASGRAAAST